MPTAVRHVCVTAYLRPDQKRALDSLSAVTRIKMADYLREAVDDLLKKYKRKRSTR